MLYFNSPDSISRRKYCQKAQTKKSLLWLMLVIKTNVCIVADLYRLAKVAVVDDDICVLIISKLFIEILFDRSS